MKPSIAGIIHILLSLLIIACVNKSRHVLPDIPEHIKEKSDSIAHLILSTYKTEDTTEAKAVRFLLDNYRYRFFYTGQRERIYEEIIQRYFNNKELLDDKLDSLKNINLPNDQLIYDAQILTDKYIKSNISTVFAVYKNVPWKDEVPFNIFCNYVLAYAINNEPVNNNNWRSSFIDSFFVSHDSTIFHSDIQSATKIIHYWLRERKLEFKRKFGRNSYHIPPLPLAVIDKLPIGSCNDLALLSIGVLRSLGIPAANDLAPVYLNINAGHSWATVVLDSANCIPFDIDNEDPGKYKSDNFKLGKVYRRSFAANKENYFNRASGANYLPEYISSPFWEDVTASYIKTSNLEIPVNESLLKNSETDFKIGCLAVFKRPNWIIVGAGIKEGQQVHYKNIGRGGVYLPGTISKRGMPINYPFLLTDQGKVHFLKPDTVNLQRVILTRKFPDGIYVDNNMYISRMIGGIFQGANRPDFKDAVRLYTIKENPADTMNIIVLKNTNKFRYIRYLSPINSFGNVSEIEYYGEEAGKQRLNGKIIGTKGSWNNNPKTRIQAAFDGDPLTYFDSPEANNSWVGQDLGKAKKVTEIQFLARNDLNGVYKNNVYELFYWNNRWISLGRKSPTTSNHVIYEHVPKNALFWFTNHTTGIEERIFTYENGKQIWW